MSTQIDSLSIQIESSAGGATTNIESLASALEKLKGASKLTTVNNNLGKLAGTISALKEASAGLSSFDKIAQSISGLSSIQKLSGLNSAINSLKKIPEITKSLDTSTLDAFATKMERLSKSLAPLASRISDITANFAKLPANIRKAVSATNAMSSASEKAAASQNKHNSTLKLSSTNLMALVFNLQAAAGAVNWVVSIVSNFLSQSIEWDGIQFRFGRAFGEDAEEVLAYVDKVSEKLEINKQQFMQYSGLYGSLLKGFGLKQEKVTTIAVGLTELSYDIWSSHNDQYKTLEDAATAVRSAITGEIEPIRNAGIALTEASMQEYIESLGMAGVKMANLSEGQKAEVRYATMVNAAMQQGIVGNYAREMRTAEGAVRTLSQQTKGLVQAIGSLFIPILSTVIPIISAFVSILYDAAAAVAAFFNIPFFKIDWGGADTGMSDMADSAAATEKSLGGGAGAAKKMRDYLMGFDELNVISPNTGGGGGGGGGAGASNWGEGLDLKTLWDDSVFENASKKVDELKEKLKPILIIAGAIGAAIAVWKIWPAFLTGLETIYAVFKGLKGSEAAVSALSFLGKPKLAAQTAIWAKTFAKIKAVLTPVITAVGTFVGGLSTGAILIIAGVIAAIASVVYFLKENWDGVTEAVRGFFETNIQPKLEGIKESWEKIKEAVSPLAPIFGKIWEKLEPIVEKVKDFFKNLDIGDILSGIGTVFETVGGIIFTILTGPVAGAFSAVVTVIENFVQMVSGIIQVVSGVVSFVVAIFKGDWEKAWDSVLSIGDGIKDVFGGLLGMVIDPITEFVGGVLDWFYEMYDKVGREILPDFVTDVVDWFISLPGKISDALKGMSAKVSEKFRGMWDDVKKWWNGKTELKEYVPNIGSIKTKISDAWTTAKTWYENQKAALKEYTPTIGSIKEKVSSAWATARNWYNNSKAAMATYTPLIGSIKDKVSSAWTTARNWYNNSKAAMNTYTPSIGDIKSKLQSAWNTAKDWWNRNVKLSIPSLSFQVTYSAKSTLNAVQKAIVNALDLPGWPKLSFAAGGGIFDQGSLVWAGEAGPEIVANAGGGKTGVMNVDQMQTAVYEGVYAAVMSAMSRNSDGGSQPQSINVYLDGKQIAASVERRQKERGAQFMGSQVYSY